jgi:hypothetical protein
VALFRDRLEMKVIALPVYALGAHFLQSLRGQVDSGRCAGRSVCGRSAVGRREGQAARGRRTADAGADGAGRRRGRRRTPANGADGADDPSGAGCRERERERCAIFLILLN